MGDSIKGFLVKIKRLTERMFTDRDLFPALLIVTVGVASFGLGRLSALPQSPIRAGADTVSAVKTLENNDEGTSIDPQVDTSAQTGERDRSFVASKNSDKYHLPWCSGAQRISDENKVWFATAEEAHAAGYTPASNCPGL